MIWSGAAYIETKASKNSKQKKNRSKNENLWRALSYERCKRNEREKNSVYNFFFIFTFIKKTNMCIRSKQLHKNAFFILLLQNNCSLPIFQSDDSNESLTHLSHSPPWNFSLYFVCVSTMQIRMIEKCYRI